VSRPQEQDRVVRWLTIGLTIGAFANSYRHGVDWTVSHSPEAQPEFWAWVIAALPEIMIVISVRLALRSLRDPRVWVIGGYAVGWTMWVNGAAAAGGLSGSVVALSPAWSALLALWAMDHRGSGEPEPAAHTGEPEPVSLAHIGGSTGSFEPAHDGSTGSFEPAQVAQMSQAQGGSNVAQTGPRPGAQRGSRTVAQHGPRARVQAWVDQQGPGLSMADLSQQFPDVSRATLKRVNRPKTAVTATDRETVNA